MPVLDINSQIRSALRAAAHPLRPVVLLGDKGLSDAVLQEIDRNLSAHGLIKVRAAGQERADRDALLYQICDAVSCAPVHHLGKVFILYRPTEADPEGRRWLAQTKLKIDPDMRPVARAAGEDHIPKKLAAAGKPAPTRKRTERAEREAGPVTARERYLGSTERAARPSSHAETGSRRGEARKLADRFQTTRSPAERRAAERRAAEQRGDGSAPKRPAAPRKSAAGNSPRRSALSLRAGARSGVGDHGRAAPRKTGFKK